jgi:sigma-B regulation protein RsbU (phosphoserine phosphatase)
MTPAAAPMALSEAAHARVLVADDDPGMVQLLIDLLTEWGFHPTAVSDGSRALAALLAPEGPQVALLDWSMPGLEGPEVCRAVRMAQTIARPHLILLSARSSSTDVVSGLEAGADDYLTKPCDPQELRARVFAGLRSIGLQAQVNQRIRELQAAAARPAPLVGALPICAYCKAIRDKGNAWRAVEEFFAVHAEIAFSHGVCDDCLHRTLAQVQDFDGPPRNTT